MTTYNSIINKPATEKITLVHIEPVQRFLIWTLHSGSVYKRNVTNFVIGISDNGVDLTEGSSASLSAGEFWYDSENNIVYVRSSDDSNPNTRDMLGTYRLFYSNAPINLPYDLSSGSEVEYEGRLKTQSPITKQLDEEQIGIALEASTSVSFHNNDGHFDEFYDHYIFENKPVKIYSWSPLISLSEKKLIFDGIVQDKSFSETNVTFKAKDFMFKLRQRVNLNLFSSSDGNILDTYIDTPKRRVYGQFQNLQCVGVDNILDGFNLTGTFNVATEATVITGIGSNLLDEASKGDVIFLENELETFEVEIESVDSDTQFTISEEAPISVSGNLRIKPRRPWRKKNREWFIADHKLRSPSTTVTAATQANRFTVADSTDLFAGDLIKVNGESNFIKRLTGNDIVLETNLQGGTPSVSDTVVKSPLSKVYVNQNESFIDRDWSVTNTTLAKVVFEDDAEFNIAKKRSIIGDFTFTNGSRNVTATDVDLTNYLDTRDWIRSDDVTHTVWYEILDVSETSLILRTSYAGGTTTTSAEIKNPDLIGDDSLITVNCLGLEDNGSWIKTASDVVGHLLENDAGITSVNSTSFSESDDAAPYVLSLSIPESLSGGIPTINTVVKKINQSVFGSLINNSDWEIAYNILSPDRPTDILTINQDDVLGNMQIISKNEIVRAVNASYRPFVDRFTGENTFKKQIESSEFVDNYVGQKDELDITLYLFEEEAAIEIAQRYLLYKSLSTSTVKLNAKLQFMLKSLTDAVLLNLDRLYKRFGNNDRKKIGAITKITKNGDSTSIEINDFGSVYNRVHSIADDAANEYSSASNEEKIIDAYICDDDLEVPDTTSDSELNRNLIG